MQHRERLDDVSELVRSLPPFQPRPAEPERIRGTLMELLGINRLPPAPVAEWDAPTTGDVQVTRGRFRNALEETVPLALCRPAAGAADRLEVHRPDLHHVFLIKHLKWVAGSFERHL